MGPFFCSPPSFTPPSHTLVLFLFFLSQSGFVLRLSVAQAGGLTSAPVHWGPWLWRKERFTPDFFPTVWDLTLSVSGCVLILCGIYVPLCWSSKIFVTLCSSLRAENFLLKNKSQNRTRLFVIHESFSLLITLGEENSKVRPWQNTLPFTSPSIYSVKCSYKQIKKIHSLINKHTVQTCLTVCWCDSEDYQVSRTC